jgi:hypothetical protein
MRRFFRDPRRGWGKRHERKERARLARRRQDRAAVEEAMTPSRALPWQPAPGAQSDPCPVCKRERADPECTCVDTCEPTDGEAIDAMPGVIMDVPRGLPVTLPFPFWCGRCGARGVAHDPAPIVCPECGARWE